jgi:hypothetical protein
MSNAGVFHWIREAVRRSVLLGFSDAVEQLGVPAESSELHPQLTAVLRQATPAIAEQQPAIARPAARPERKRLGRSLEQIRDTAPKPAS